MKDRQYNQKLTPEKAAKGIEVANKNALSLLSDAILLFDHKRFERSVALAILAIEEAGKSSIIRSILVEDDPKELKKGWQNYRRHHEKNAFWIVPELAAQGASHIEDLRKTVDKDSDHNEVLDNLKQLAFYTDAFSKCKWSIPSEVITEEIASGILQTAKIMAGKPDSIMSSAKELEIWVKHVKPVWKKEMVLMKQALINCYQEAEDLGLIEKGMTTKMIEFLL
jgi:AbiV family abortive infection protein